jgi:predicted Rossmann-fold nucleotide-binding protein
MKDEGFMTITGAGPGIMAAGNEGAGRDYSFGLNISLPFERTLKIGRLLTYISLFI